MFFQGLLGTLGSISSAFTSAAKVITSDVKKTLPLDQVVHTLSASGAPANVSRHNVLKDLNVFYLVVLSILFE